MITVDFPHGFFREDDPNHKMFLAPCPIDSKMCEIAICQQDECTPEPLHSYQHPTIRANSPEWEVLK